MLAKFCLLDTNWFIPQDTANLFGAVRKHDIHTGIDIFIHEDAPVYLPFDGEVVKIGNFTGSNAEPTPSPWWNDTQYVIVKRTIPTFYWYGEPQDRYVLYGEICINPEMFVGCKLHEGDIIGNIVQVLKNDKGRPMSMLHIEQ